MRRHEIRILNVDGSGEATIATVESDREKRRCWSPDGSHILYLYDNWKLEHPGGPDIRVVNSDGSDDRKVGMVGEGNWPPDITWSADGDKILFVGRDPQARIDDDVCVVNWDGSGLLNLTPGQDGAADPCWSPDGKKIAFLSNRRPGGVYVMNADGSQPRLVSSSGDVRPRWSPDGSKLAVICREEPTEKLLVVGADGSGKKWVGPSASCYDDVVWSPDGRYLAFSCCFGDPCGGGYETFVYSADGSKWVRLSGKEKWAHWPRRRPDGTKIAFVSDGRPDGALCLMNGDGSEQRVLAGIEGPVYGNPCWSPDGSRLVFFSETVQDFSHPSVVNADGSGLTRLAQAGLAQAATVWSPDGEKLAFGGEPPQQDKGAQGSGS